MTWRPQATRARRFLARLWSVVVVGQRVGRWLGVVVVAGVCIVGVVEGIAQIVVGFFFGPMFGRGPIFPNVLGGEQRVGAAPDGQDPHDHRGVAGQGSPFGRPIVGHRRGGAAGDDRDQQTLDARRRRNAAL